jgi:hypothetical protein
MRCPNLRDHYDTIDSPLVYMFKPSGLVFTPLMELVVHNFWFLYFPVSFYILALRTLLLFRFVQKNSYFPLFHSVYASPQFLTTHFPVMSLGLILMSGAYIAFVI